MSGQIRPDVAPTWTWGSSATIVADNTTPLDGIVSNVLSAQLAQVSLLEPAVCSAYMQATFSSTHPEDTVDAFTINFFEGIGRVTVPRTVTFAAQPSIGSPIEWTLPFLPLHALNVDVSAVIRMPSLADDRRVEIQIYFVLAPITRIPMKVQKLAFGMALPGEADDLDDDLREELQAETPTAAAIMSAGLKPDASDGLIQEAPAVSPLHVLRLELEHRLGRPPTRAELVSAVNRIRARAARRRGGR